MDMKSDQDQHATLPQSAGASVPPIAKPKAKKSTKAKAVEASVAKPVRKVLTTPRAMAKSPSKSKTSKFVKVSVLFPRDTYKSLLRVANVERRPLSPAVVVLVERGIVSPITAMNMPPKLPPAQFYTAAGQDD